MVDATTAEHTRGIRTVAEGILRGLAIEASGRVLVAAGPTLDVPAPLEVRRVALARSRPGRLLYQRLLLPLDAGAGGGRSHGVDRVLLLDSYAPLVRPTKVRYAALVHDVLPLSHPEYWPSAKRLVKRTGFAALSRAGATIFTSSAFNAGEIERITGQRARTVTFGCGQLTDEQADEALRTPLRRRESYVVFVGALEPRKGLMTLVEIFERVARHAADLQLLIVGTGSTAYTSEVRRRVAACRVGSRIEIVSRATRDDVLELVSTAGALLFPTRAEGFGIPILEALALGTPVVASDLPSLRSWADTAVAYAPPDVPEAWVAPALAALDATEAARRSGQELARSYRWRRCASQVLRF